MAFLEQDEPPYIFHIRSPLYIRTLGLPLIAVVFGSLAYIYWKLGAHGSEALLNRSVDTFAFWFAILAMMGALAFAVWVIRPPQSTLARFEFTRERIRFIPNLVARSIGEPSQDAVISLQSTEVLLCYRVWPGQQRGYRIIVRAAVWGPVCGEPLSAGNSLLTGKFTGNLQIFRTQTHRQRALTHWFRCSYAPGRLLRIPFGTGN